jgi:DNA-binding response OmpR family regulator
MPHVDGRQVAAAVKKAAPTTLVIMLTGWGQRLSESEGPPAYVDFVLSKPPNMWSMREALARVPE